MHSISLIFPLLCLVALVTTAITPSERCKYNSCPCLFGIYKFHCLNMAQKNTSKVTRRSARNLQRLAGATSMNDSCAASADFDNPHAYHRDNTIPKFRQNSNVNRHARTRQRVNGTENMKSPTRNLLRNIHGTENIVNSPARNPGFVNGTENMVKSPARTPGFVNGTEISNSPVRNPMYTCGAENSVSPDINPDNAPENSKSPGSHQRDYTLNMDKAWKKKLGACNTNYKVRSKFKGGNHIFEFSAAMYELYRSALVQHFEIMQENSDSDIKIHFKDCSDKSGANVESQLRVLLASSNNLKYSVNMYHTKSKIMVNGGNASSFALEHAKITDSILSSEDVNQLDKEYSDTISEGMRALMSYKSIPKSNQHINTKQTSISGLQLPTEPSHVQGDILASANNSRHDVSSETGGDPSPCPSCNNLVINNGILCDGCENWFHFGCELIMSEDEEKYDCSEDPYYCLSCVHKWQCGDLDDLTQLEHDRNPNEANPHPSLATTVESVVLDDQTCPKQVMSPMANISSDLTHPKQIISTAVIHSPARQGCRVSSPSVTNIKTPMNKLNKTQPSSSDSLFKKKGKDPAKSHSGTKPDQNSKITTNNQVKEGTERQGSNQISSTDSAPAQLEGGGPRGNGPKPSRQAKRGEKQKLKESELEEQLKLSRSLVSNLERKVIELENSNKILRRGSFSSIVDSGGNMLKDETGENCNFINKGNPHLGFDQSALRPNLPRSTMEHELHNIRESIRNVELEQLKSRIQNIELHILNQKQANTVPAQCGPINNSASMQPIGSNHVQIPLNNSTSAQFTEHSQAQMPFRSHQPVNYSYNIPNMQPHLNHTYNPSHDMLGPQVMGGTVQWGSRQPPQLLPHQHPY